MTRYQRKRLKLNITGLSASIRLASTPQEAWAVMQEAYREANNGIYPTEQELEQMLEAVNTIREREGLDPLWMT